MDHILHALARADALAQQLVIIIKPSSVVVYSAMSRLVRYTLSKRYTTLFRIEAEKFGTSRVPVLGRTPSTKMTGILTMYPVTLTYVVRCTKSII